MYFRGAAYFNGQDVLPLSFRPEQKEQKKLFLTSVTALTKVMKLEKIVFTKKQNDFRVTFKAF